MQFQKTNLYSKIDPYFQRLLEYRQRGMTKPFTVSTNANEIAVIARVNDTANWSGISEVKTGAIVGKSQDGSWIVTGRVPISRLEAIRQSEGVHSLKPARKLRSMLNATVEDTRTHESLLPDNSLGRQGEGAIVGVVDFGCDFVHENFRNPDGTTRILGIWDQNGAPNMNSPFGYGTFYSQDDINRALQTDDPYATLGYGPAQDSPFRAPGTHGTHVMDIAAGNGRGTGFPGVAPQADIIFVEPATADIPWTGEQVVGSSLGDSVQLLEALRFIVDFADDRPCVMNLSLGTNGGPHDGTSLVEQGIDAILTESDNRAVVIAASNSFADGIHVEGDVIPNESTDIFWEIRDNDFTDNEIEIWYSKDDQLSLELIAPDGRSVGSVDLGSNGRIVDDNGDTLLFVSHRADDPNNGDNTVGIYMENVLPAGAWTLRLHGEQVNNGHFHGWIERDDNGQSIFSPPHDNSHTLGSISTGHKSIVVGSYDAHKEQRPLSWFSSAGPTRDNRQKPEICAPGHDVFAAHSRTLDGGIRKSGTSMAAPAVSGIVALMMSEANARNQDLSVEATRQILEQAAHSNPHNHNINGWDDRLGFGMIDGHTAVSLVIELP